MYVSLNVCTYLRIFYIHVIHSLLIRVQIEGHSNLDLDLDLVFENDKRNLFEFQL